jgi:hypothetical protein
MEHGRSNDSESRRTSNKRNKGGDGMTTARRFACRMTVMMLLIILLGCSGTQVVQSPPENFEPTCIQGTVWYRTPKDSSPVPYPYATITAWRHGTKQGLAETKADEAGNYCIEVPRGDFGVDLKVWGARRIGATRYTCKGSQENVNPDRTSKKCGEGCLRIDIITECQEFEPPYHRAI